MIKLFHGQKKVPEDEVHCAYYKPHSVTCEFYKLTMKLINNLLNHLL